MTAIVAGLGILGEFPAVVGGSRQVLLAAATERIEIAAYPEAVVLAKLPPRSPRRSPARRPGPGQLGPHRRRILRRARRRRTRSGLLIMQQTPGKRSVRVRRAPRPRRRPVAPRIVDPDRPERQLGLGHAG